MDRMSWTDGWHVIDANLSILIENGKFVRGTHGHGAEQKTVYPYEKSKTGGYDNASGYIEANKRNFEKLSWF